MLVCFLPVRSCLDRGHQHSLDSGENAEAISLTRRLIHNDKVLAILGPFFSAETEVAFPIAVQGKTPIMTASSAKPGITAKNRPWAFRNALASDQMNGKLIDAV